MAFVDNSRIWKDIGRYEWKSLTQNLGFVTQTVSYTEYAWFSSKRDLGLCVTWSGNKDLQYVANGNTNPAAGTIREKFFTTDGVGYWQVSADGKVIYLRSAPDDTSKRGNIIIAEKEDGNWGIITDTSLHTASGVQTIADPAIDVQLNNEFTAVKMRDPESGVNFTSLYRVLSAPCFAPLGMYIDFGGTPMRAATVQTASDADAKICFAFPVA